MMIKNSPPVTAASIDAGHKASSASATAEDKQFTAELKKQLSSPQNESATETPVPQNAQPESKKPAEKAEGGSDENPTALPALLPLAPVVTAVDSQIVPVQNALAQTLPSASPALSQSAAAAQPDKALASIEALTRSTLEQIETAVAARTEKPQAGNVPAAIAQTQGPLQAELSSLIKQESPLAPAMEKEIKHPGQQPLINKALVSQNHQPHTDKTQELTEVVAPAVQKAEVTPAAAVVRDHFAAALPAVNENQPVQVASAHITATSPNTAAPVNTSTFTAPGTASATLQAEVGTAAWQSSLGQHIATFTRGGVHHAELRLHPEELGALQINLRMNNEQAQLHFITEHHHVRAALESAMPQLRTMLAESGIELGQSSVGADSAFSGYAGFGDSSGQDKSDAEGAEIVTSVNEERTVTGNVVGFISGINTFA